LTGEPNPPESKRAAHSNAGSGLRRFPASTIGLRRGPAMAKGAMPGQRQAERKQRRKGRISVADTRGQELCWSPLS